MSSIYLPSPSLPRTGPTNRLAAGARQWVKRLFGALVQAYKCRKTTALLHTLNDDQLRDIGLTRTTIEVAVDQSVRQNRL